MRYGKTQNDILVNHLEGTAKAVFHSLPQNLQKETLGDVVKALMAAFRFPRERLKNIRELDQLSKSTGNQW